MAMRKTGQVIVFTDLDGTLADFHTYSYEQALPALDSLKKNSIPLIICSSKTRAEIEKFRSRIDNPHPFISENGAAIFIPLDYFSFEFPFTREDFTYRIIEFGTPYHKIRGTLQKMQSEFPDTVKGFGDISAQEVANLCEIPPDEGFLAKEREYDEPFLLKDKAKLENIQKIANEDNLQIIQGGRFYHLIGENDKGKAVSYLTDISRRAYDNITTIALGDSLNDLPMLQVVDFPVLVKKPDGSHDPNITLDNLIHSPGKGPGGWNFSVLELLEKLM
ncbi:MAG: HAD-IIB family hydrolase [Candidatus Aminicenantes bacterium]|nr:MAG: HAD-IIB family hydrolase [Candidatus Aminicenantes bacterium]